MSVENRGECIYGNFIKSIVYGNFGKTINLRQFAIKANIPYSTLMTLIPRDIGDVGASTACAPLNIEVDFLDIILQDKS